MASLSSIQAMIGGSFNGANNFQNGTVNSKPGFGFNSTIGVKRNLTGNVPTVNSLGNPTLHNSVPEVMVNSTVRVPLMIRPWKQEFEKNFTEGDLIFVKKENNYNISIAATLPVMNWWLKQDDVDEEEYKKWNYFGILNNDMDTGSKYQRLLNINTRGRSRVARLWREDKDILKKGDQLWLALQKVDVGASTTNRLQSSPNGGQYLISKDSYYQWVPKTAMQCQKQPFTQIHHIGVISQVSQRRSSFVAIRDACSQQESCNNLERIEILTKI